VQSLKPHTLLLAEENICQQPCLECMAKGLKSCFKTVFWKIALFSLMTS